MWPSVVTVLCAFTSNLRKDYWQGVCQELRDVLKLLCVRAGGGWGGGVRGGGGGGDAEKGIIKFKPESKIDGMTATDEEPDAW